VPERPVKTVSTRHAYLLLAAVIVVWGMNWPIMKIGLAHITPLWFAVIRVLSGSACLFALLGAQGRLRWPRRADAPVVVTVGVLQIALALALINSGLQFVDAGRSAILVYTTPLWVAPMAVLLLHEQIGRFKALGLVLGLLGVVLLFNPASFDWTSRDALLGNGLLLGASLSFAGAIIYLRGTPWSAPPIELMPWQMALGGLLLLPAAVVAEGAPRLDGSATLIAVLAFNGPIASAFAFWAYVTVARSLPATSTALGSLGIPVVGFGISAAALAEPLSAPTLIGLALILAGVATAALAELRRV
jgi:drug/metabolite transporter (DMT)-like permease